MADQEVDTLRVRRLELVNPDGHPVCVLQVLGHNDLVIAFGGGVADPGAIKILAERQAGGASVAFGFLRPGGFDDGSFAHDLVVLFQGKNREMLRHLGRTDLLGGEITAHIKSPEQFENDDKAMIPMVFIAPEFDPGKLPARQGDGQPPVPPPGPTPTERDVMIARSLQLFEAMIGGFVQEGGERIDIDYSGTPPNHISDHVRAVDKALGDDHLRHLPDPLFAAVEEFRPRYRQRAGLA